MQWKTISKIINAECRAKKKSYKYTRKLLDYAWNLHSKNLPLITSPKHFSLLIGMNHQYICNMAYDAKRFYRHFSIPKRNGSLRSIDEPLPDLKNVQTWILKNILEKVSVSEYAKAYVKGRTLKHNARFHKSQKVVVSMDIKDFFPSISIRDVTSIFVSMGYYHDLSCFLAHLCCLDNVLPQGAPTSPYLSNLRMLSIDNEIRNLIISEGIRYTRYADDLTFSGSFDPHWLVKTISGIVFSNGFQINKKKTRVARNNTRQEVTGIVVNSHMQISKEKRRKIRQQLFYIRKYGLDSHLSYIGETRAHYLNHLIGTINFALFVNPKDSEMREYYNYIIDLMRAQNA